MRSGEYYENPISGESVFVHQGSDDTDGELFAGELRIKPGGRVVGEHVHSYIDERFDVLAGRVRFRLNGEESTAGPGQAVHIPPGAVHDWWNDGEDEARALVEVRPGRRFELAVGTLWGLAADGKTNAKGIPNILQLAVIASEYRREIEFVKPPRALQHALFAVLAPLGRTLGYRATYPLRPTTLTSAGSPVVR
ncbi:MAG: cupin domain-containing protein [Actinobacteria bacterium]|nr:cupin domain-containing protein [Actinomycetota bacterium]